LAACSEVSTDGGGDGPLRGPIKGGATSVEGFLDSFPAEWECEQFESSERYIVNVSCDSRRSAYFYYSDAAAMRANRMVLQDSSDESRECVVHSGKTFALAFRWQEVPDAPGWELATQDIIDSFGGPIRTFGRMCPPG